MPSEVLGVAPWVIIAAVASWFVSLWTNRAKARRDAIKEANEQSDRLEIHRDDLTLQIIRSGREELALARVEVDDLREEVRKLRGMETHFYHFQQSLDHLEALITASTPEEREQAERNARAFLNRMRRLQAAKGTIANEVQHASSEIELLDRDDKLGFQEGKSNGGPTAP